MPLIHLEPKIKVRNSTKVRRFCHDKTVFFPLSLSLQIMSLYDLTFSPLSLSLQIMSLYDLTLVDHMQTYHELDLFKPAQSFNCRFYPLLVKIFTLNHSLFSQFYAPQSFWRPFKNLHQGLVPWSFGLPAQWPHGLPAMTPLVSCFYSPSISLSRFMAESKNDRCQLSTSVYSNISFCFLFLFYSLFQ